MTEKKNIENSKKIKDKTRNLDSTFYASIIIMVLLYLINPVLGFLFTPVVCFLMLAISET